MRCSPVERLISLSHAKLRADDVETKCLRKAVLVQNALRAGLIWGSYDSVPTRREDDLDADEEGLGPVPEPGYYSPASSSAGAIRCRTRSSHDVALEESYASGAPHLERPQHHEMVDVTDALMASDGLSPPRSPELEAASEAMDLCVVPEDRSMMIFSPPEEPHHHRQDYFMTSASPTSLAYSSDGVVVGLENSTSALAIASVPDGDSLILAPIPGSNKRLSCSAAVSFYEDAIAAPKRLRIEYPLLGAVDAGLSDWMD